MGMKYDRSKGLWVVSRASPNGFMGLFNDAYHAVARSMCTLGKQRQLLSGDVWVGRELLATSVAERLEVREEDEDPAGQVARPEPLS